MRVARRLGERVRIDEASAGSHGILLSIPLI
jgi:hypothetical protein